MSPLRRRDMQVRAATTDEIKDLWEERWLGCVVGLSTVYTPDDVEGLALVDHHDDIAALVTFLIDGPSGQVVTLDTIVRGRGFGRRMLEVVEGEFHGRGLGRAWALMTNDNLRAVGLYISRGYRLTKVHLDAVERVRKYKPQLPQKGYEGIPILDMWELEKLTLGGGSVV